MTHATSCMAALESKSLVVCMCCSGGSGTVDGMEETCPICLLVIEDSEQQTQCEQCNSQLHISCMAICKSAATYLLCYLLYNQDENINFICQGTIR